MQQKPPLLQEGFRAGGATDGKMGGRDAFVKHEGGEKKGKNISQCCGDRTVRVHAVYIYMYISQNPEEHSENLQ